MNYSRNRDTVCNEGGSQATANAPACHRNQEIWGYILIPPTTSSETQCFSSMQREESCLLHERVQRIENSRWKVLSCSY